jgi:hypothetical protein
VASIMKLHVNSTISVGDLVTAISVVIAGVGLLLTWRKDRLLRQREYSDRIRRAAAETAATLDRWQQLALQLYDDIQPLITDTDMMLVESQDLVQTRDHLWRGIMQCRANASERIINERVELSYVNLYGYDPGVQKLFTDVTTKLREADAHWYKQLRDNTQDDVLSLHDAKKPYRSAELGNMLRATCHDMEERLSENLESLISPFRARMIALIQASDGELVTKAVVARLQ